MHYRYAPTRRLNIPPLRMEGLFSALYYILREHIDIVYYMPMREVSCFEYLSTFFGTGRYRLVQMAVQYAQHLPVNSSSDELTLNGRKLMYEAHRCLPIHQARDSKANEALLLVAKSASRGEATVAVWERIRLASTLLGIVDGVVLTNPSLAVDLLNHMLTDSFLPVTAPVRKEVELKARVYSAESIGIEATAEQMEELNRIILAKILELQGLQEAPGI